MTSKGQIVDHYNPHLGHQSSSKLYLVSKKKILSFDGESCGFKGREEARVNTIMNIAVEVGLKYGDNANIIDKCEGFNQQWNLQKRLLSRFLLSFFLPIVK